MPPAPPQSPPKRMTRARAKAVEDIKPKIVKVATPASKANASRLNKRKTRADEEIPEKQDEPASAPEPAVVAAQAAPARTEPVKATKPAPKRAAAKQASQVPSKEETAQEEPVEPKRMRGRPKKNATVQEEDAVARSVPSAAVSSKAESATMGRRAKAANTGLSAPPLRKKVTFELDATNKQTTTRGARQTSESEASEPSKTEPKRAGVTAKPLRRVTPAAKRGKKIAEEQANPTTNDTQPSAEEDGAVISSKKLEDEADELDNEDLTVQSPVKLASTIYEERPHSPVKPVSDLYEENQSATPAKTAVKSHEGDQLHAALSEATGDTMKQVQNTSDKTSPSKPTFGARITATPAKRAPAIMRNSALRTSVKPSTTNTLADAQVPSSAPPKPIFAQPAKRIMLGLPPILEPSTTSNPQSSLFGSPARRLPQSMRTFAPTTSVRDMAPRADLKGSLYGTPARKPASPTKDFAPPTAARAAAFNSKPSLLSSPAKRPSSPEKTMGRMANLDSTLPTAMLNSSLFGSPARRPISPAKNFKASGANLSPGKSGSRLLASPPRRPVSPEKTFPAGSGMKLAAANAQYRASALGSPVLQKRTPAAGRKSNFGSPQQRTPTARKSLAKADVNTNLTPKRASIAPERMVTCALNSSRSPEARGKVHNMTAEEQAAMFELELLGAPSPFTPWVAQGKPKMASSIRKSISTPLKAATPKASTSTITNIQHTKMPKTPTTVSSVRIEQSTTPVDSPALPSGSAFHITRTGIAPASDLEDSEDELQMDETQLEATPAPLHSLNSLPEWPVTPGVPAATDIGKGAMTALVDRFGEWQGISSTKSPLEFTQPGTSLFEPFEPRPAPATSTGNSPLRSAMKPVPTLSMPELTSDFMLSPQRTSYFDAAMDIREDLDELAIVEPMQLAHEDYFRQSHISDASEEYGDENVAPIQAPAPRAPAVEDTATCTPARVFERQSLVIHTVSKIPLKPSADYDESPVTRPTRRSHSLSGPLSPQAALDLQALRQIHPFHPPARTPLSERPIPTTSHPKSATNKNLKTRTSTLPSPPTTPQIQPNHSTAATPSLTPRASLTPGLLTGIVAYIDVHTTEGADASGIFVELLTQMGAKCVKQWNWNGAEDTKVGITHVVFKDGGKRTMERVREAGGLVCCVGVAWVLDCERANAWLDETTYTIDTCLIPRGGHRRRKSMEPVKARQSLGAPTLVAITASSAGSRRATLMSPTKEFLNLASSPVKSSTSALSGTNKPSALHKPSPLPATPTPPTTLHRPSPLPATPLPHDNDNENTSTSFSPTTPYFMHPSNIVQKTCPPKQMQQPLFPASAVKVHVGKVEEVRRRLELQRRRSLGGGGGGAGAAVVGENGVKRGSLLRF